MPLAIDLPRGLEDRLREKAAQEGVDPELCALRLLESKLVEKSPAEMDESELLLQASQGLPESVWKRYHELIQLRQSDEGPSEDDHQEFCELNDVIEATHARRMGYVAELASRRGVELRKLMDQLGFPNYGQA